VPKFSEECVATYRIVSRGKAAYLAGFSPAWFGAIVGFVMRETKGRADGGEITRIVREKLGL